MNKFLNNKNNVVILILITIIFIIISLGYKLHDFDSNVMNYKIINYNTPHRIYKQKKIDVTKLYTTDENNNIICR